MPYMEEYLLEAIRLSRQNVEAGAGGPFGAVVVKDGEIIGRGRNSVTTSNDPTAHAEVLAIRAACARLGTFSLGDCEIYSSCEPCPMCLSAIYWARLDALYFAGSMADAADAGFDDSRLHEEVAKSWEHRALKSEQHLQSKARDIFCSWKKNPNRIEY